MHETYADQGLKIIAVHVKKGAELKQIKSYIKKHAIPYIVCVDETNKTAEAYHVKTIPHMLVIDGSGKCVWDGHAASASMERAIKRSLADKT